jgi:tetratricopeptide (TPR) repeat protein
MADSAAGDMARAEGLAGQALAASPSSPLAHYAKGEVLRVQNRYDEGILEFETVLAFNRNAVGALFQLGWCKLMTGSIAEVIPLAEKGIRLSPRDPLIGNFYNRIGLVHLLQSFLRRSLGSKRRATLMDYCSFTHSSPPPTPSKANRIAPLPNLPKPGD